MHNTATLPLETAPQPPMRGFMFLTALPVAALCIVELVRWASFGGAALTDGFHIFHVVLSLGILLVWRAHLRQHAELLPAMFSTWGGHWMLYPISAALCGAAIAALYPTPFGMAPDRLAIATTGIAFTVGMMVCSRLAFQELQGQERLLDRFSGITRLRHFGALAALSLWSFSLMLSAGLRAGPVFGVNPPPIVC